MTTLDKLVQPDNGQTAHTIRVIDTSGYDDWLAQQPESVRALASANGFTGAAGEYLVLPGTSADDWHVVAGVGDSRKLSSWCLAKIAESLPEGTYRLATDGDAGAPGPALFGWLVAQHSFERYKSKKSDKGPRILLTPGPAAIASMVMEAEAVALVRDLVNTPAEDMGPEALEAHAAAIARTNDAKLTVTRGDVLQTGYPMVHAVGRAAARSHAPRLIELEWGDTAHPRIAIVGKGVCFDSGGLDIKPSSGMLLMKKDMGGAAHALALARLVMQARLPVRLHLLIPAVENAVAGNAFRPGDVLTSRKGDTVEISNTDAEGRLVLADALTRACEEKPELVIDFATLTGAARVALGPDLPAMFSDDDDLANAIAGAGLAIDDPVWRLPLWEGYEDMLKSDIADVQNAAASGFAGSVTAALFLKRFVTTGIVWAHFDTFAWRPATKPGRPKGGEALGLRASWHALQQRYAGASISGAGNAA